MSPAPTTTRDEDVISIRVPRALSAAVKTIAHKESETAATIWRRLMKRGLALERRAANSDEVACRWPATSRRFPPPES